MLPPVACCANVLLAMRPTPPTGHVAQRSDSDAHDKSRMAATPPGSLAVGGEHDPTRRAKSRKEQFDAAHERGWRSRTSERIRPHASCQGTRGLIAPARRAPASPQLCNLTTTS